MAGRWPSPATCATCSGARTARPASSMPRRWRACRSRPPSPGPSGGSKRSSMIYSWPPRAGRDRRRTHKMAATQQEEVLGTNFGSDQFPIDWQEGEKELFWIYDDLHIPNPVSPLFFDIGGGGVSCDPIFRRFGTPLACDRVAQRGNGNRFTPAGPAW